LTVAVTATEETVVKIGSGSGSGEGSNGGSINARSGDSGIPKIKAKEEAMADATMAVVAVIIVTLEAAAKDVS